MLASWILNAALALMTQQEVQAEDANPTAEEAVWRFDAFIYYWSAAIAGELTVDGEDIDLEGEGDGAFFNDPALLGFLGHFEASRGPWSFAIAPIFVNVETSGDQSGNVDADVELNAQVHEAFVARTICGTWQGFAGARYYQIAAEVDLSVGGAPVGSPEGTQAWVDPIVGVRYLADFGEHWSMRARGDIGGFGLGSEFAWNASLLFGYHFSRCFGAHLGYRALYVNFNEGSDIDRAEYDLTMYGPIIGVSFSF